MTSISFHGLFATKLNEFLAYKRSLGMKYAVESETLKHFDRWCVEEGVAGLVLCRELVERWSAKRIEESAKSHTKAMHMVEARVGLIYIRDQLGHVHVKTTEGYARASPEMRRAELEKAAG